MAQNLTAEHAEIAEMVPRMNGLRGLSDLCGSGFFLGLRAEPAPGVHLVGEVVERLRVGEGPLAHFFQGLPAKLSQEPGDVNQVGRLVGELTANRRR